MELKLGADLNEIERMYTVPLIDNRK